MSAKRRPAFRPGFDKLDGRILLSASPLTPAQIRQAYSENISFNVDGRSYAATGTGQTIAIIEAGLDPNAYSDLTMFDHTFSIAVPPNFESVYFQGAQYNESAGWIEETSLDVEWAHAVAPGANILLVGAATQNPGDLMNAVNWARQQPGVSVVSMSFGFPEGLVGHMYDSILTTPAGHTGVTFVAASGDSGYFNTHQGTQVGVDWPASDPNVLSVGGTTLSTAANGSYGGETAWDLNYEGSNGWWGGGGGFSSLYAEPSYQYGVQQTGVRTVPDVSYDADPNTGVYVYDSLAGGWQVVGGTSVGAPQWAGLIAEVNQGRALVGLNPLDGPSQTLPAIYHFSSAFNEVTIGSNGYLAGPGYNLATGLGSPIAYELVGDLAFQVTSNYDATQAVDAASSHSLSVGGQSSIGMTPLLDVAGSSTQDRTETDVAISASTADSSTQDPILIGLVPTSPPSQLQSIGRRLDHQDLALGALMDEDLEFLGS